MLFHEVCYNTIVFLKTLKPSGAQKEYYHFTTAVASWLQAEVMFCLTINVAITMHTETQSFEMFDILHFLVLSYKI